MNEFHTSLLAGHFGARKVCSLLFEHVLWPNMLLSCKLAVSSYAIFKKNKSST